MCIRFNTKSTDTSWCRKSLFDQIFQSNTVISVGQNFQKISSVQKLVRYFGIEWEYKKSHPSPTTLEFLYMGKCKRSWFFHCWEKKDAMGVSPSVRCASLMLLVFIQVLVFHTTKCNGSSLEKKRVKISYSWVRELLRSIGSHAGFGDFNAKV